MKNCIQKKYMHAVLVQHIILFSLLLTIGTGICTVLFIFIGFQKNQFIKSFENLLKQQFIKRTSNDHMNEKYQTS